MKFDAFFVQFSGLVRRGLAVDRAVLDLAVMDLARLLGKTRADVIGVLGDVLRSLPVVNSREAASLVRIGYGLFLIIIVLRMPRGIVGLWGRRS